MKDLRGKNVLLTGASYGLGVSMARLFAKEGANLALVARSADKLDALARELDGAGRKVVAIAADLSVSEDRETVVTRARQALGSIDVLVNNAGLVRTGQVQEHTAEDIEALFRTNCIAPIDLTRRLLPEMLERKSGHVVHLASAAGKVGASYFSLYGATKAALVGFNNSIQAELATTGVCSTAICPGFVSAEGMWARLRKRPHPAFGWSTPESVARAVIKAIRTEARDVVVNPLPVRPAIALWAALPGLAFLMFKWLGVHRFLGVASQIEVEQRLASAGPAPRLAG